MLPSVVDVAGFHRDVAAERPIAGVGQRIVAILLGDRKGFSSRGLRAERGNLAWNAAFLFCFDVGIACRPKARIINSVRLAECFVHGPMPERGDLPSTV